MLNVFLMPFLSDLFAHSGNARWKPLFTWRYVRWVAAMGEKGIDATAQTQISHAFTAFQCSYFGIHDL